MQYALAIKSVSMEVIQILIEADPNLVNVADYNKFTPLHQAIWNLRFDLVQLLVQNGAQTNTKTMVKETALHFAAARGNLEIIKYLVIEGHCETKAQNNYQSYPLGKLCAKYFENMENKQQCVKFLLKETFEEVPGVPGYFAIKDIFEPAMLNIFSPRRKPELDCMDELTQFFLDNFYSKPFNKKYKIIENLNGPIWKLCLFFHHEIENINDIMPPGLRNILTFSKELNQIIYSHILVTYSLDEKGCKFICEILEEIFKIGLREYLEKDIFASLLYELYLMKPRASIIELTQKLLELHEKIDINAIYLKLVRRLSLTKSMEVLDKINPLILPFCTFASIETVIQSEQFSVKSLKSLCRNVIRFLILRKSSDSTIDFCKTIMLLNDLPISLRIYLRFIDNDYNFWGMFYN